MDHTPPAPAESHAHLTVALDRVDAALAQPDGAWLERLATLGVWGAWLRWILQLLAFEFVLAGTEQRQLPGGEPCAARQLSPGALDRRIDRLIEAAARLWNPDDQASSRPRRPRWRGLLRLVLRWLGSVHRLSWRAFVAVFRFRGATVLALCKPRRRSGADSHHRPCGGCARVHAPVATREPARAATALFGARRAGRSVPALHQQVGASSILSRCWASLVQLQAPALQQAAQHD